jgi:3-oxoacyl-[acyl-carrier-protein] synthase II
VSQRKVWITGVGVVSPLGNSYLEFAHRLFEGVSGIRPLSEQDGPTLEGQIAACVGSIPACPEIEAAFPPRNRLERLTLSCCIEALRDAGWWDRRAEVRVAVSMGMGAEWLRVWEESCLEGGRRLYEPALDENNVLDFVKEALGLSGPVAAVAAACASGNYAIAQGKRWIEMAWADVCLAGGCDLVTPMAAAGFGNLRALSRRTSDPSAASRPFDRERDGFVLGEGGAVLVLESSTLARRRGARPYAEVAGYGASSDASHMIIPSADPQPAARAIRAALDDAQIGP